jgi:hypothetical protein
MRGTLPRRNFGYVQSRPITYTSVRSPVQQRRLAPPPKISIVDASYYAGKSIILFAMFYCSMNWVYYRNMRKDMEHDGSADDDADQN